MKKTLRQRPLQLDHLRTFDAVARRLSFSAAANELHLTQSAISRQIKALEEDLGAPLFSRGISHSDANDAKVDTLTRGRPPRLRMSRTTRSS